MNNKPAWVLCELCEDYYCTIHDEHVADCECGTFEQMLDAGVDPYVEGGK